MDRYIKIAEDRLSLLSKPCPVWVTLLLILLAWMLTPTLRFFRYAGHDFTLAGVGEFPSPDGAKLYVPAYQMRGYKQ